jgi:ketosteroid isomerase-like protein
MSEPPAEHADHIRWARRTQTQALADGQLDAVARFWTPDVTIRRALGHEVSGALQARQVLEPGPGPTLVYQREAVTVEVAEHWPLAWEEGRWTGHPGAVSRSAVIGGRYAAQWVCREGRWLIRSEVFVALHGAAAGLQLSALP